VKRAGYLFGRSAQLMGMWLLLVDLFTAGPLGPDPRLFAAGVAVFLVGWSIVRLTREQGVVTIYVVRSTNNY
jgi:hypothetical protein